MEQKAQSAHGVRFGVYEIDLEAGELRKHGRRIRLQEQPFQVLALLLVQPGKLVTREELQKRIWPADTFVDFDLGLNTAIKKIRAAFGDSADHPKFVETLPKRGYRFIFPVEQIAADASSPANNGNQIQAQTNPSDVASPPLVVEAHIQGGIAAGARANRYWVWPAAGALLLVALLAGLGFTRLRHGTVPKAAGQPVPSIESLRLEEHGTRSIAAYQSYSRGRDFLQANDMSEKNRSENNEKAVKALEQALQDDSSYGLAYAGLGQAYWKKFEDTKDHQWSARAENACNQALKLAARRAEAQICQAAILSGSGQYERAIDYFNKAIELEPCSADAYMGRGWTYQRASQNGLAKKDYLQATQCDAHSWLGYNSLAYFSLEEGRYGEAARMYEQAIAIKPGNSELQYSLGVAYIEAGQYDKALSALDESVKLRPSFGAYADIGTIFLNRHQFQDAIGNFRKAIELGPGDYRLYGNLARAYFWTRDQDQRALAKEQYQRAIAMAMQKLTVNEKDAEANLSLAISHAMLGEKDDAFYYLGRAQHWRPDHPETAFWDSVLHLQFDSRATALALLRRAQALGYSITEINMAPELESLHNDPEFQRLVAKGAHPAVSNPGPQPNRRTK